MEVLEIVRSLFDSTWSIFKNLTVPAFGFSFADWFMGLLVISIALSLVRLVFDFGGSGTEQRSGHSGRKHISDNRKGDEK